MEVPLFMLNIVVKQESKYKVVGNPYKSEIFSTTIVTLDDSKVFLHSKAQTPKTQ